MTRPLEAKVGENRPVEVVKQEAEAFLYEMFEDGFFPNVEAYEARQREVLAEIDASTVEAKVWVDSEGPPNGGSGLRRIQVDGLTSPGWKQDRKELEWGIRAAWKNSRKCIMRAHYQDLCLVDLRDVTTSKGMVNAIIENIAAAYNEGRIQPTAFIFPPRAVDEMGPMFWIPQLVSYAAYELPGGTIMGDPVNLQITSDIIKLGWTPPHPKSRWDVLPVVAMAEGDEPAWGTLPPELTKPILIQHPGYGASFEELDLRWCRFPALSKLGFDIGGVQYTGAPFVGWFMDAEIAVRNLTDTFRYNVLPDVIKAIGWQKKKFEFEDLPDHEKLLWMSRAQAELNYAVQYSFMKEGVTLTSSLTASESWVAFDDQHLQEKGYRLSSDPYWIAPPQGSIIPVWHRGAAPNYQAKPLVTKHHFDPVKVWQERSGQAIVVTSRPRSNSAASATTLVEELPQEDARVHVLWSGTGGTALKIAERLRKYIKNRVSPTTIAHFGSLNTVSQSLFQPDDIVLAVVATTGQGQLPLNGQHFNDKMEFLRNSTTMPVRYAVFGLGDSGYHNTFNTAAESVGQYLEKLGATPLISTSVLKCDVAIENPPLSAFMSWWEAIDSSLDGRPDDNLLSNDIDNCQKQFTMIDSYNQAPAIFNADEVQAGHMLKLSLELPTDYEELSHIRLLPQNAPRDIEKVMGLLGIEDDGPNSFVELPLSTGVVSEVKIRDFLTHYVALDRPFRSVDWVATCPFFPESRFDQLSAIELLEKLCGTDYYSNLSSQEISEILLSMKPFRPRSYSVASSSSYASPSTATDNDTKIVDILVRVLPNGRFSSRTLTSLSLSSAPQIRYKLDKIEKNAVVLNASSTVVAIACGTGFGPVRSLIQLRIKQAIANILSPTSTSTPQLGKLTLFLGFKPHDSDFFTSAIDEAERYGVLDAVHLVPSNPQKKRVQDQFEGEKSDLLATLGGQGSCVYICGSGSMVTGVKENMEKAIGGSLWKSLVAGGRVIEEVF